MISKDKTYRTRDGREVRIYATDGAEAWPVHGAVKLGHQWFMREWTEHGMAALQERCVTDLDLFEVKPRHKRTVWLNVYADKSGDYSQARSIADCMAGPNRIACVKVEIDCEEGEGL